MELYFLRHGIAEDQAPTDFERRLTPEGRAKCRAAADGLAKLELGLTAVWTSPLVRARETAGLVVPEQRIEIHDVLANEPPQHLLEELSRLPDDSRVLLVGHEPQFSRTIEYLLGVHGADGVVDMKKAGLAQVSVDLTHGPDEPSAVLRCLLTPKLLRTLGGATD